MQNQHPNFKTENETNKLSTNHSQFIYHDRLSFQKLWISFSIRPMQMYLCICDNPWADYSKTDIKYQSAALQHIKMRKEPTAQHYMHLKASIILHFHLETCWITSHQVPQVLKSCLTSPCMFPPPPLLCPQSWPPHLLLSSAHSNKEEERKGKQEQTV